MKQHTQRCRSGPLAGAVCWRLRDVVHVQRCHSYRCSHYACQYAFGAERLLRVGTSSRGLNSDSWAPPASASTADLHKQPLFTCRELSRDASRGPSLCARRCFLRPAARRWRKSSSNSSTPPPSSAMAASKQLLRRPTCLVLLRRPRPRRRALVSPIKWPGVAL
jgi:hypothetical protein